MDIFENANFSHVCRRWLFGLVAGLWGVMMANTACLAEALKILAFGDSLTAGYGLAENQGFTRQLEAALQARGHDVKIVNAGVSGDTAAQGLSRLDWVLSEPAGAIIVELGANDALRGLAPVQTEDALRRILQECQRRKLPVLLAGMLAPPNLGKVYGDAFNGIYEKLAGELGVALYPFFLSGVAGRPEFNQADGLHPTAEGIAIIVNNILPAVEGLIKQAETLR
jgi:acyl-CoA thioesterase-1